MEQRDTARDYGLLLESSPGVLHVTGFFDESHFHLDVIQHTATQKQNRKVKGFGNKHFLIHRI
jgi:hypothetical protein